MSATTLDRGKKSRQLRDEWSISRDRRPHAKTARLSRRDGSRWIDLRKQFLAYCDGHHTLSGIAKHMNCSQSTLKRIKAEYLALGIVEETVIPDRRGRPRILSLTEHGKQASSYPLLEFRSVLHSYAPTVAEMEAIRRRRREANRVHIRTEGDETSLSPSGTSKGSGSYVNRNGGRSTVLGVGLDDIG